MVPRESKQLAYAVSGLFLSISVHSLKSGDLYMCVVVVYMCVWDWDGTLAMLLYRVKPQLREHFVRFKHQRPL